MIRSAVAMSSPSMRSRILPFPRRLSWNRRGTTGSGRQDGPGYSRRPSDTGRTPAPTPEEPRETIDQQPADQAAGGTLAGGRRPPLVLGLAGLAPAAPAGAAPSPRSVTAPPDRRPQPDPGLLRAMHPIPTSSTRPVPTTPSPPAPLSGTTSRRSSTPPATRHPGGVRTPASPTGRRALPATPSWETPNTQTSPGVFFFGGRWIMFYDASVNPYPGDSGHSCLSVATASLVEPRSAGVHRLLHRSALLRARAGYSTRARSSTPATGAAYLLWKSNDGSSTEPSQVWSVQLAADGTTFSGTPTVLLTVDQAALPWETTVDDPQLVSTGGTYDLLFSVGNFESAGYAEALTTCSGPLGPCTQPARSLPDLVRERGRPGRRIVVHRHRRQLVARLRRLVELVHQLFVRRGAADVRGARSTSTTASRCRADRRPEPRPATG